MAVNNSNVPGLATPDVLKLCKLAPSTLNNWIDARLCGPSVLGSDGHRAVRYWSVRDVVTVRAIHALRQAGCPLQRVRKVVAALERQWGEGLSETVLLWDGRDVLRLDTAGNILSVLRQTGQSLISDTVMQLTTIPIGAWENEVRALATNVPVAEIGERRRARRHQYGTAL